MNNCPACDADLQGEEIPQADRHYFGDATHFQRRIGVEVSGVYDGVLFWKCPDCGHAWHRWPEGNCLRADAEQYIP
jgi:hypothetical protein